MRALHSRGVEWILGAALAAATSFAVAQAPIIDGSQPSSRSSRSGSSAAPAQEGGSSATAQLYLQMQALQQEVSELRGIVEEQRHQLETLKQQSLDRYNDLDSRLGQGAGQQPQGQPAAAAAPIDASAAPAEPAAAAPGAAAPVAAAPTAAGMATAKPEEYDAYRKAYDKLKAQDFGGSIKAFNSFLATYPNSTLAGNAYYWLGKAYLQPPQDAAKAQQAFGKVSGDLPQHAKAPDALYELGKIAYAKGDKAKAKSLMQQVIDNYGTSGSTAPQLAKQFLDQNFKG